MSELHTTAAQIAAALRRAADHLDLIGDTELSPVALQLNLQAVTYRGTSEERKATVDKLGMALVGEAGVTDDGPGPHHSIAYNAATTGRNDMNVAIYTGVEDFR